MAALCMGGGFFGGRKLYSQESAAVLAGKTPETDEKPALPRKFREIELGMGLEALKNSLLADGLFHFRGDRDVSFLPAREQTLIETTGHSFIRRAFFFFFYGELFIMAFTLNSTLVDHYSMFTSLSQKYGKPSYLDPKEAVWENDETRVSLERPLTVKYIDKKVFNDIINESSLVQSHHVQLRQEFLNEF
jgi:hypothetical protein